MKKYLCIYFLLIVILLTQIHIHISMHQYYREWVGAENTATQRLDDIKSTLYYIIDELEISWDKNDK